MVCRIAVDGQRRGPTRDLREEFALAVDDDGTREADRQCRRTLYDILHAGRVGENLENVLRRPSLVHARI